MSTRIDAWPTTTNDEGLMMGLVGDQVCLGDGVVAIVGKSKMDGVWDGCEDQYFGYGEMDLKWFVDFCDVLS